MSSQEEVFVQLDATSREEGEISKPGYKRIVEDVLGITPGFLGEKNTYTAYFRTYTSSIPRIV
jgi:hypothetical protein